MKIGPLETKPVAAPQPVERKPAVAQGADGRPPAEASAQVALSPAATLLSKASADPAFDKAKVEQVTQAIRDGRFTIDAEVIADKLIRNAQELLGGPQS